MSTAMKLVWGLFFGCVAAWAQGSTAQISGTVHDATGLAVPGAEVKATQTATGAVRTATTGTDGAYVFANLSIGPYQVEVSKEGFSKYVQSGIVLQVGDNPTIEVSLKVGAVTEQVQVEANAAMVETRSTGVGQVINNTLVLELPLNGRQAQELLLGSGTAIEGGNQGTNRNYPTQSISVGGGLDSGLAYILDGGTHNDPYNNLNLPLPFPDALQEFKVETSAVPAQYGQHSAGIINIVTKFGTNEFHGDLFYFIRNTDLNARNFFALTQDGLKRNQFGGVLGGPIKRNKLFFFIGEQGTLIRSAPASTIAFVPTAAMLAGDWTAFASPACNQGKQLTLKAPFVNNQINPTSFSTVAFNLAKHLPAATNACGQVTFGQVNNSDEHIIVARSDYQISSKHSLFGRYQLPRLDAPTTYDGKNVLSLTQPNQTWRGHSFVLGDTYLIGSSIVSSFRATLLRTVAVKTTPDLFTLTDLGEQNAYYPASLSKLTLANVSSAFNLGNGSQVVPGYTNSTIGQGAEDLSMIHGAHQIGFGWNYIHTNMNASAASFAAAPLTFNASNTGASLGDFMIGKVASFTQAPLTQEYMRQNYNGLYAQDTWKMNSRLTLNAGLRWEPYMPARDDTGHELHFQQNWFDQGLHSKVYLNAPAGVLYNGDPGLPSGFELSTRHWAHFLPRLGLAWDPKGDGRMTVRAAYGIFYDYPALYAFPGIRDDPPWGSRISLTNVNLDNPWVSNVGGNPFPIVLSPNVAFPTAAVYTNMPVNFQNAYVQQWNLSVQRQIGTNWLATGNYLGNEVTHALFTNEGDAAIYIPGASCVINGKSYTPCSSTSNTNQRRLLYLQNPAQGQYYANVVNIDDGLTRHYEALVFSLQRRQAKGFTVQANYTYGHCIDQGQNPLMQLNGGNIESRRTNNRGNCEQDIRHNFNLTTVYMTPKFSNKTMRLLASSWQLSGILRIRTGSYMTISSGIDNALSGTTFANSADGATDQTANLVGSSPFPANKTINSWLNSAAFAQPATGTYGNVGPRNVEGAGQFILNAGLVRQFQVRERMLFEFRAEAFNLPNHTNPGNPTVNVFPDSVLSDGAQFGRYLSANDPRILQFALKFVF